jgi:hypothetical protein
MDISTVSPIEKLFDILRIHVAAFGQKLIHNSYQLPAAATISESL